MAQERHELGVNVLGQVRDRRLTHADKGDEFLGRQRLELDVQARVEVGQVVLVEAVQHGQRDLAPVFGQGPSEIEEALHRSRLDEFEEVLASVEAARRPDELGVFAVEARGQLDADAQLDAHDLGGLGQLGGGGRLDVAVVDDGELADALEPGVGDEQRRRFAALGVGVVDVVVEGDLGPGLGHLQEVVALELASDQGGATRERGEEVVGQAQLLVEIAVLADQRLHDREQDARGVVAQAGVAAHEDFVAQGAQRGDAFVRLAGFEGGEQLNQGVGDALVNGRGEHLDAARVQVGVEEWVELVWAGLGRDSLVHEFDQLAIGRVEKEEVVQAAQGALSFRGGRLTKTARRQGRIPARVGGGGAITTRSRRFCPR